MTERTRPIAFLVVAIAAAALFLGAASGGALAQSSDLNGEGTEADPYVITDAEELQAIEQDLDAHYVLDEDVDASETEDWNGGSGFEPIGADDAFTGVLDGQGHVVEGLRVDRRGDDAGIVGTNRGTIRDLRLEDVEIVGGYTGGVASRNKGEIANVRVVGHVEGSESTGGIAGRSSEGSEIRDSTSAGTVVAGLFGGGVIGDSSGDVVRSGSSAGVQSQHHAGGVVGKVNEGATVRNSFATGDVQGAEVSGSIVGNLQGSETTVTATYATGDVSDDQWAGAHVGQMTSGSLQSAYAAGGVSASEGVGGVVGSYSGGDVSAAYWNEETAGVSAPTGNGEGSFGTAMQTDAMTGPDATNAMSGLTGTAWTPTDEYPVLEWEVQNVHPVPEDEVLQVGEETSAPTRAFLVAQRSVGVTSVTDAESSDPSVATYDDGTIVAEGQGTAEFPASLAGVTGKAPVLVIDDEGVSAVNATTETQEVAVGESVEVTGTFRNVDEDETEHEATLLADGESVSNETIAVEGGADETHSLTWEPAEAGTYELSVGELSAGSITVSEAASESSESEDPDAAPEDGDDSEDDGLPTLLLGGLAGLLLVGGAGVGYYVRN